MPEHDDPKDGLSKDDDPKGLPSIGRRRLLKALAAGGGVAAGTALLPERWVKPIVEYGTLPLHAGVSPVGFRAYISNWESNNVSVIDTATNTVVTTVGVGNAPCAFGEFIG
jgi:YVTN family beta-propeller protein